MKSHKSEGFTIPELIVSIVVLGIVSILLITLFTGVHTLQLRVVRLETAKRSAEQRIEILRNNTYNSLTPGEPIDFTAELPDELPSPRNGTVQVSEPVPGVRQVDVTIEYNDLGKQRQVTLSSTIGVLGISQ